MNWDVAFLKESASRYASVTYEIWIATVRCIGAEAGTEKKNRKKGKKQKRGNIVQEMLFFTSNIQF